MIAFATLLDHLTDPAALARYLAATDAASAAAAQRILSGTRPKRLLPLADLITLACEISAVPPWLFDAALAACGDRAETIALLLPPPRQPCPRLGDVMADLAQTTDRRATILTHWAGLPPPACTVYNRLITGTFRRTLAEVPTLGAPRTIAAVVTLVDLSPPPQITLSVQHGNHLIPVARLPLPAAHAALITAFARAHATEKFGPVRAVPPHHIFALTYHGIRANTRRKSGFDLIAPEILTHLPDATPDQIATLSDLAPPPK